MGSDQVNPLNTQESTPDFPIKIDLQLDFRNRNQAFSKLKQAEHIGAGGPVVPRQAGKLKFARAGPHGRGPALGFVPVTSPSPFTPPTD